MKFLAILNKELRETLPWMVLAILILLLASGVVLSGNHPPAGWRSMPLAPGSMVQPYMLLHRSPMAIVQGWLLGCSVGLGVVIAARQFWLPQFTRTWAFTIHRAVKRSTILLAKFAAAAVCIVVGLGVYWTAVFRMTSGSDFHPLLLEMRVYWIGGVYLMVGLLGYVGVALSGLIHAKWYGTKMLPVGFAALIASMAVSQLSPAAAACVITVGGAVLVVKVFAVFATRDF